MSGTCPSCRRQEDSGLLCTICTNSLTADLRGNRSVMGVAELVDNLHVAQAKQARAGEPSAGESRKGDVKHERLPLNTGAMDEVRALEYWLGTWARDLTGDTWRPNVRGRRVRRAESGPPGPFCLACGHPSCRARRVYETPTGLGRYVAVQAADVLLDHMADIRRHPAADDLVDEVSKAIDSARNSLDVEPFTRFPVGPCPEDDCARTVYALCPAEGSQRPALMACYLVDVENNRPNLGAGFVHSWNSTQFFRVGVRIRRKMEAMKGAA